ncbi:MAG: winged helix-turn-helix transcriptional regulator [Burkholderiales bacterium]|nr:winged helix-turn-helix transcriptional regulator [Burkholderiales bacterium]
MHPSAAPAARKPLPSESSSVAAPVAARAAAPVAVPPAVQGCTNLKLRRLGRVVARHYEACLAGSGLRINQYSLLSAVVKLGPVGLGELASVLRLDSSTLSRNLQPLVEQGLVEVCPGEVDARAREAIATAAGQSMRAEAQRAWKQAQLALNERLGRERVAALHALLDESLAILEAPPADV